MKPIRALVIATLLCVGCQASTGSPSPSAPDSTSPSASAPEPSPSTIASTASSDFPSIELPPWSRAKLVSALTAFTFPDEPPSREVPAGTEVIVTDGPRDYHGGTWYAIDYPTGANEVVVPWVRIDDPTSITAVTAICPANPSDALPMLPWDRMTCVGAATLTVEGEVSHCQGGVVQVDPEWLGYACWRVSDSEETFSVDIHADPTSGITFPDSIVRARMTGHFDDPAAVTCVYAGDPDAVAMTVSASEQVLLCREAFVVDTFEILEVMGSPPAA